MSPTPAVPVAERFWDKVAVADIGCWEWLASLSTNGYGQLISSRADGKQRHLYAHRVAYELLVGPIADGLQIDHLCRNRTCVRPDHLELVTPRENTRRGISGGRTHCKRGHEFTPENTYRSREGNRRCRLCQAAWARASRRRRTSSEDS